MSLYCSAQASRSLRSCLITLMVGQEIGEHAGCLGIGSRLLFKLGVLEKFFQVPMAFPPSEASPFRHVVHDVVQFPYWDSKNLWRLLN